MSAERATVSLPPAVLERVRRGLGPARTRTPP
jgi:hypothetical protein